MSLAPGSSLGPYAIRAELGHGGMGVVYTAQDPRLKRQVAIKLLTPDLTRDETAKRKLFRETTAPWTAWSVECASVHNSCLDVSPPCGHCRHEKLGRGGNPREGVGQSACQGGCVAQGPRRVDPWGALMPPLVRSDLRVTVMKVRGKLARRAALLSGVSAAGT